MRAVVIEKLGGPEVMELKEWADPQPGSGELLVDIEFAGINYMDTGTREMGGGARGRSR